MSLEFSGKMDPQARDDTELRLLRTERDVYAHWLYAILGAAGWDPTKQMDPRKAVQEVCERLRANPKAPA